MVLFKKEADKFYSNPDIEVNLNGEVFKKRRVYPILNQDGSIKWFNFLTGGTWWRLIGAILFIIIGLGFIFEYVGSLSACSKVMSDLNNYNNLTSNLLNISALNLNP